MNTLTKKAKTPIKNTSAWEIQADGITYLETTGDRKSVKETFLNPDVEFYKGYAKITMKEVGIFINNRIIRFEDLNLIDAKELKGMTPVMLDAIINEKFTNTNSTFFMWERGFVEEDRSFLTEKGLEIKEAYFK